MWQLIQAQLETLTVVKLNTTAAPFAVAFSEDQRDAVLEGSDKLPGFFRIDAPDRLVEKGVHAAEHCGRRHHASVPDLDDHSRLHSICAHLWPWLQKRIDKALCTKLCTSIVCKRAGGSPKVSPD